MACGQDIDKIQKEYNAPNAYWSKQQIMDFNKIS